MAQWEKINMLELIDPALRDLADQVGDTVEPVADLLAVAADLVKTFAKVIEGFADPIVGLVESLKKAIEDYISDMRTAGAYTLPIYPYDIRDKKGADGFIHEVHTSFDDIADPDRPQFSGSAEVVGYVFMYGAPDLKELWETFMKWAKELFDLGELKDWSWTTKPDPVPPRRVRSASGRPPDWKNVTVSEVFPLIGTMLKTLQQAVENFFPGEELGDFVDGFVDMIERKAKRLQEMADILQDMANLLDMLFNIADVWFIKIGPLIGQDEWRLQFRDAVNRPPYRKKEMFVTGAAFFAGGPSVSALEKLLG